MALHHQLPIYRETYELLKQTTLVARNIPRDVKRAVSEELLRECLAMVVLIFRANVAKEKAQHIEDLREKVQVVELLLRMAKDMHWIGVNQHSALVKLTQSIGRQSTGWINHSKKSPVV